MSSGASATGLVGSTTTATDLSASSNRDACTPTDRPASEAADVVRADTKAGFAPESPGEAALLDRLRKCRQLKTLCQVSPKFREVIGCRQ